jgi:hypothetical protein
VLKFYFLQALFQSAQQIYEKSGSGFPPLTNKAQKHADPADPEPVLNPQHWFFGGNERQCVNFVKINSESLLKLAYTSGQEGAGPGVPWDRGSLVSPAVQREGVQIRGEAGHGTEGGLRGTPPPHTTSHQFHLTAQRE